MSLYERPWTESRRALAANRIEKFEQRIFALAADDVVDVAWH